MDIIDIILARAKSFTGETKKLVQDAQAAMSSANEVVENVSAIEAAATSAAEVAEAAAASATSAAEELEAIKADITGAASEIVDEAISSALTSAMDELRSEMESMDTTSVTITDNNTSSAKIKKANITKNGQTTSYDVEKNYTSYGDNEDGSMTQKAIKTYVNDVKSELQTQINNINVSGGSGGVSNLGSENAGSIVVVGQDGNIAAGNITESSIIEALIRSGSYEAIDGVGLSIDYVNKEITRSQESSSYTIGADFNKYSMYGGRMRCNVDNNGEITAFYGDDDYKDDGSNGQVMIYQPKFYYQRTVLSANQKAMGKVINRESLIISPTAQTGFKLHPIFINENGEELDYVLFSAYEGGMYDASETAYDRLANATIDASNDQLSSVSGIKPRAGMGVVVAEQLAKNRGTGWHITNLAAESANQMLEIVEFGTLNGQTALEDGISSITNSYSVNRASQTGSTASLGNATGIAQSTTNISGGATNNYNIAGKRAISYRGMENPWGNIWKAIGGLNIYGTGTSGSGMPYICKDYNYTPSAIGENYEEVGFILPSSGEWISAFGYGEEKYDWVFLPAECSNTANSAAPVGDGIWYTTGLNGVNVAFCGGNGVFGLKDGHFTYAFDKNINEAGNAFGARLMFIPQKNNIYSANISKWEAKMEEE